MTMDRLINILEPIMLIEMMISSLGGGIRRLYELRAVLQ
jgi:hypothetical protein